MTEEGSLLYEQSPLRIDYAEKNLARMNLNENLVMPRNFMRSVLAKCLDKIDARYYPSEIDDGEILELRSAIAKYCRSATDSVAIGAGSDQTIDLLFRSKLRTSSDSVVIVEPTFSMYRLLASRLGAKAITVNTRPSTDPEEPFSLNYEELVASCKAKSANLLVLASPNNPTGVQYQIEEIRSLLESRPNMTVMLDEAYAEYGEYNATGLLSAYQNLVISRTFSKAFGLASFRLGYLVSSNVDLIREINEELQYPYPISSITAAVATEMLRRKQEVLEFAEKTKLFRKELIESLQKLGKRLRIFSPSRANFVLAQTPGAKKIARELLEKYAIALKYMPSLGDEKEFLRITVGTRELNQKLLYALRRSAVSE